MITLPLIANEGQAKNTLSLLNRSLTCSQRGYYKDILFRSGLVENLEIKVALAGQESHDRKKRLAEYIHIHIHVYIHDCKASSIVTNLMISEFSLIIHVDFFKSTF